MKAAIHAMIHATLRPLGLRLTQLRPERNEHNKIVATAQALGARCIVDVGANRGIFAKKILKAGWTGSIVSFEPLPDEHADLLAEAKDAANWLVAARCALGDAGGEASMEIAGNSVSSSLLRMKDEHVAAAPGSAPTKVITVPVSRLDERPEVPSTGEIFLKIDTQGYELNVLKGSAGLLGRVPGILLEASLASLYEGQPLLREVINYTHDLGYDAYDLIPGFHHGQSGRMLQVNLVVIKREVAQSLQGRARR